MTTLDQRTYLNVVEDAATIKTFDEKGWKADAVEGYCFVRYEIHGDEAKLWIADNGCKEKAVQAGKIKGTVENIADCRFSDSSAKVAEFVAKSSDQLFAIPLDDRGKAHCMRMAIETKNRKKER